MPLEESLRALLSSAMSWHHVVYTPEDQKREFAAGKLGLLETESTVYALAASPDGDPVFFEEYELKDDLIHRPLAEAALVHSSENEPDMPEPILPGRRVIFPVPHHFTNRVPTVFICASYTAKKHASRLASSAAVGEGESAEEEGSVRASSGSASSHRRRWTTDGPGPVGTFKATFGSPFTIHAEAPLAFVGVHFRAPLRATGAGPVYFVDCFFCEASLIVRCQRLLQTFLPNERGILATSSQAAATRASATASPEPTGGVPGDEKPVASDTARDWSVALAPAVEIHGDGTRVLLSNCDVYASQGGRGLVGRDRSNILVVDCSLVGAALQWAAVEAEGSCELTMRHVNIEDVLSCGVVALESATVRLENCEINQCGLVGVFAGDNATVDIVGSGVELTASGTNVVASCAARVTLESCTITALLPTPAGEDQEEISAFFANAQTSPQAHAQALRNLFTMPQATLAAVAKYPSATQGGTPPGLPLEDVGDDDDPCEGIVKMPLSSQSVIASGLAQLTAINGEFMCNVCDSGINLTEEHEFAEDAFGFLEDLFMTEDEFFDEGATRWELLPSVRSVAQAMVHQLIRSLICIGSYFHEVCHAHCIRYIEASGFSHLICEEDRRPTTSLSKEALHAHCVQQLPAQMGYIKRRSRCRPAETGNGEEEEGEDERAASSDMDLLFPRVRFPLEMRASAAATLTATELVTLREALPALRNTVLALGAHPALTGKGTYHVVARARATVRLVGNIFSLVSTYDPSSTVTTAQEVLAGGAAGCSTTASPSIISFSLAHGSTTENPLAASLRHLAWTTRPPRAGVGGKEDREERRVDAASPGADRAAAAAASAAGAMVAAAPAGAGAGGRRGTSFVEGAASVVLSAGAPTLAVEVCEQAYPCAAVVVDLMPFSPTQHIRKGLPAPPLYLGQSTLTSGGRDAADQTTALARMLGLPPFGVQLGTEGNVIRYEVAESQEEGPTLSLSNQGSTGSESEVRRETTSPEVDRRHSGAVYKAPSMVNKSAFGLVIATPSPVLTPSLFPPASSAGGHRRKANAPDRHGGDGVTPKGDGGGEEAGPPSGRYRLAAAIDAAAQAIEREWCRRTEISFSAEAASLSTVWSPAQGLLQQAQGTEGNSEDLASSVRALDEAATAGSATSLERKANMSGVPAIGLATHQPGNTFVNVQNLELDLTQVAPQHVATRLTLFAGMNGFLSAAAAVYAKVHISEEQLEKTTPHADPALPSSHDGIGVADVINSSDAPAAIKAKIPALATTNAASRQDGVFLSASNSFVADVDAPPRVREAVFSAKSSERDSFAQDSALNASRTSEAAPGQRSQRRGSASSGAGEEEGAPTLSATARRSLAEMALASFAGFGAGDDSEGKNEREPEAVVRGQEVQKPEIEVEGPGLHSINAVGADNPSAMPHESQAKETDDISPNHDNHLDNGEEEEDDDDSFDEDDVWQTVESPGSSTVGSTQDASQASYSASAYVNMIPTGIAAAHLFASPGGHNRSETKARVRGEGGKQRATRPRQQQQQRYPQEAAAERRGVVVTPQSPVGLMLSTDKPRTAFARRSNAAIHPNTSSSANFSCHTPNHPERNDGGGGGAGSVSPYQPSPSAPTAPVANAPPKVDAAATASSTLDSPLGRANTETPESTPPKKSSRLPHPPSSSPLREPVPSDAGTEETMLPSPPEATCAPLAVDAGSPITSVGVWERHHTGHAAATARRISFAASANLEEEEADGKRLLRTSTSSSSSDAAPKREERLRDAAGGHDDDDDAAEARADAGSVVALVLPHSDDKRGVLPTGSRHTRHPVDSSGMDGRSHPSLLTAQSSTSPHPSQPPVGPPPPQRVLSPEEEAATRHGFTDTPLHTTPFRAGAAVNLSGSSSLHGPPTATTDVATPIHATQAMVLMLQQEILDLKHMILQQQQWQQLSQWMMVAAEAASPDAAQRLAAYQAATAALGHTQKPSSKGLAGAAAAQATAPTATATTSASTSPLAGASPGSRDTNAKARSRKESGRVGRRLRLDTAAIDAEEQIHDDRPPCDGRASAASSSPREMPSSIHSAASTDDGGSSDEDDTVREGREAPARHGARHADTEWRRRSVPNTAAGKLFMAKSRRKQSGAAASCTPSSDSNSDQEGATTAGRERDRTQQATPSTTTTTTLSTPSSPLPDRPRARRRSVDAHTQTNGPPVTAASTAAPPAAAAGRSRGGSREGSTAPRSPALPPPPGDGVGSRHYPSSSSLHAMVRAAVRSPRPHRRPQAPLPAEYSTRAAFSGTPHRSPTPIAAITAAAVLPYETAEVRAADAAARRWNLRLTRDLLRANLGPLTATTEAAWSRQHRLPPPSQPQGVGVVLLYPPPPPAFAPYVPLHPPRSRPASASGRSSPYAVLNPYRATPSGTLGGRQRSRRGRPSRSPSSAFQPTPRGVARDDSEEDKGEEEELGPDADGYGYNPNVFLHPEPGGHTAATTAAAAWAEDIVSPDHRRSRPASAQVHHVATATNTATFSSSSSGLPGAVDTTRSAYCFHDAGDTRPRSREEARREATATAAAAASDHGARLMAQQQQRLPRDPARPRGSGSRSRASRRGSALPMSRTSTSATDVEFGPSLHARTGWDDVMFEEQLLRERQRHRRLSPRQLEAHVSRLYTQPMLEQVGRELTRAQREDWDLLVRQGCTFHPDINPPRTVVRGDSNEAGRRRRAEAQHVPSHASHRGHSRHGHHQSKGPAVPPLPLRLAVDARRSRPASSRSNGKAPVGNGGSSAVPQAGAVTVGRWAPQEAAHASVAADDGEAGPLPSLPVHEGEPKPRPASASASSSFSTAASSGSTPSPAPPAQQAAPPPPPRRRSHDGLCQAPRMSAELLRTAAARTASASRNGARSPIAARDSSHPRRRLVVTRETG